MSGKKNNLIVLAIILLGLVAFFALASLARADGGFVDGQTVYAVKSTGTILYPAEPQQYWGSGFKVKFGEELTISSHPQYGVRLGGFYRVKNSAGQVAWIGGSKISTKPPVPCYVKVNDAVWGRVDKALAVLPLGLRMERAAPGYWGLKRTD